MRSRLLKPNSAETENLLVTANNSKRRNVDINSVMLGNIPVYFLKSLRNLGFVFDNQLKLNEQINNVKRKVIVNLIDISHLANFIYKDSKMKLVHGLVFSITEFYNSVLWPTKCLPKWFSNINQYCSENSRRFPKILKENSLSYLH